jgi:hypothetical protein
VRLPPVFSGIRVFKFLVVCPFVLFLFAIVLSVLFRFTASDYLFGIFKLFFHHVVQEESNSEYNNLGSLCCVFCLVNPVLPVSRFFILDCSFGFL